MRSIRRVRAATAAGAADGSGRASPCPGRSTGVGPRARAAADRRRVSDDTTGVTFTCTVNYGGSFVGSSVTVKKDSSRARGQRLGGARPGRERLVHEPRLVQLHGRRRNVGRRVVHVGHVQRARRRRVGRVTGSCTDNAGNYRIDHDDDQVRRDAARPSRRSPARAPDANGWYNHPVDVAFRGTDGGSGVIECSPTVTYKGPGRQPGEARRAVPGRRRAPERADDRRVALRQHRARPSERAMGP